MKTINIILTVLAVAAIVNVQANPVSSKGKELPSVTCLIQVKEMPSYMTAVEKKEALDKICQYYASGSFSKTMLLDYTNLIVQAQYNIETISHAAKLTSEAQNYAEIFKGIAKTAAETNNDGTVFRDVMDLMFDACMKNRI